MLARRTLVLALAAPLLLAGCAAGFAGPTGSAPAAVPASATDTPATTLRGTTVQTPTCSVALPGESGTTCLLAFSVTNTGDVPDDLAGNVYAVAAGKTYAADPSLPQTTTSVDDTLDRGQAKSLVTEFTVPTGARISTVFIADAPDASQAQLTIPLEVTATPDSTDASTVDATSPAADPSASFLVAASYAGCDWSRDPATGRYRAAVRGIVVTNAAAIDATVTVHIAFYDSSGEPIGSDDLAGMPPVHAGGSEPIGDDVSNVELAAPTTPGVICHISTHLA